MSKIALASLIAGNLIPLYGVIFWGWDTGMLLALYWFENVVIGIYAIPKIAMAGKSSQDNTLFMDKALVQQLKFIPAPVMSLFFIFHFGGFTLTHGVFVFGLLNARLSLSLPMLTVVLFMFLSHGISLFINYIGNKEYEMTSAIQQMIAPYKRVVVMHIAIVIGAVLMMSTGQSTFGLLVLVLIKTVIDLVSHIFEHTGGNSYALNPVDTKAVEKILPDDLIGSQQNINKTGQKQYAHAVQKTHYNPGNLPVINQVSTSHPTVENVASNENDLVLNHELTPDQLNKIREHYRGRS